MSLCEQLGPLTRDDRVGAIHVSLYVALLQVREEQGGTDPFYIARGDVMRRAKIWSPCTYFRLLRDLQGFGLVEYRPSRDGRGRSVVSLSALSEP